MTELNTEPLSTVIDNDAPAPGSAEFRPDAPAPEPVEPEKPMSLEDAVKQAAAETKESADKEPKPKVEPKEAKPEAKVEPKPEKVAPERGDNGKFTAKPKAELDPEAGDPAEGAEVEQERGEPRPSEGRDINRAPAHFLPRAKEAWAGVNPDVRGEVHRMMENYEKGLDEGREAVEYRKELREFDEMAKGAGTTVKEALANYTNIDKLLRENPAAGVERILQSIGVTPQQYAQHVMGQANQPAPTQADRQTQALQQQVQTLTQQIQQLTAGTQQDREQARNAEIERSIIAPFKAEHPRYQELEPDIAFFLNSGKVPFTLPERQRLEAAYDMAERINPVGSYTQQEPVAPAPNAQRPLNPAGSRSVKGALSYGAEVPRKSAKLSLDEAIKMAARSVNG